MTGLTLGPHVTRFYSYQHLREVAKSFPSLAGDVLSISDSGWLCHTIHLEPTSLVEADYPEHDLLSLRFADKSFDFVVCDMVLEHVEGDPQQAMDEILRVLRPGGIVVLTTVFIYQLHAAPGDYWRFSPDALRLLARKFSRILDCDCWGNFAATRYLRTDLRFTGIPYVGWHPLHRMAMKNDPTWPIVSWIVAQK